MMYTKHRAKRNCILIYNCHKERGLLKIIIQSVIDKTVYTIDKPRDFKKYIERCINNRTSIKITQDNKLYLLNPANIVWVEISDEQGE